MKSAGALEGIRTPNLLIRSFANTSVIYLSTFILRHISETLFQVVSRYFIGVAE